MLCHVQSAKRDCYMLLLQDWGIALPIIYFDTQYALGQFVITEMSVAQLLNRNTELRFFYLSLDP